MKFTVARNTAGNEPLNVNQDDNTLVKIYNVLRNFPDAHAAVEQALTESKPAPPTQ